MSVSNNNSSSNPDSELSQGTYERPVVSYAGTTLTRLYTASADSCNIPIRVADLFGVDLVCTRAHHFESVLTHVKVVGLVVILDASSRDDGRQSTEVTWWAGGEGDRLHLRTPCCIVRVSPHSHSLLDGVDRFSLIPSMTGCSCFNKWYSGGCLNDIVCSISVPRRALVMLELEYLILAGRGAAVVADVEPLDGLVGRHFVAPLDLTGERRLSPVSRFCIPALMLDACTNPIVLVGLSPAPDGQLATDLESFDARVTGGVSDAVTQQLVSRVRGMMIPDLEPANPVGGEEAYLPPPEASSDDEEWDVDSLVSPYVSDDDEVWRLKDSYRGA